MVVFFCSTPYQIFLAINMKKTFLKKKEVDIFILNHFESSNKVANRLKATQLFRRVEHIDCTGFTEKFTHKSIKTYFLKFYVLLFYKKTVSKYFSFKDAVYDEIYFTYPDVIIQLAVKELNNYNNKLKIYLYEDGLGSYNSHIISNSIYKKIFNLFFNFKKSVDYYDSLMLLQPSLYKGISNIPISKIPTVNLNDKTVKQIVNYVFDYNEAFRIKEKVIYFDQPWNTLYNLHSSINKVLEKILLSNYIIKLHPRSHSNIYSTFNTYSHNSISWEVLCMNDDLEEKILISYYSTACFTSKLVFDKEPVIILLYNLEELPKNNIITDDTKKFVEGFINTYRDKSKIYIPKNIDELKENLKELGELDEIY